MRFVVKVGTSSLTAANGHLDPASIEKLCTEIAYLRWAGHEILIVTSAAITAGLPALGYTSERPKDTLTLQAAASVGQSRLLRAYDDALARHDLVGGQILLSPHDFFERRQYVHARDTLVRLIALGIVPIINENDAVADDEIRFGDNDRLAALVATAVNAELLVLLTDTAGLFTADPRFDRNASLIEEIVEIDKDIQAMAGRSGSDRGSGGMASKVAAARMASWAGIRTIIAASKKDDVVRLAVEGATGVGTIVQPRHAHLNARKLWIAFATPSAGSIVVDDGAQQALEQNQKSLLAAGVRGVVGNFESNTGVEIVNQKGHIFAKGLSRYSSAHLSEAAGSKTRDMPPWVPTEVVHRDDLVLVG